MDIEPDDFNNYLLHAQGWIVESINDQRTIFVHESGITVYIPKVKDPDYVLLSTWAVTRIAEATWKEKIVVLDEIRNWKTRAS